MNAEQLRDLSATLSSQLAERDARISEHEAQLARRDEVVSAMPHGADKCVPCMREPFLIDDIAARYMPE